MAGRGRPRTDRGAEQYTRYLAGHTRVAPLFSPDDRTVPYDATDPRHGTLYGYTAGCLCTWCRTAGSAYRSYRKLGEKLPKGWRAQDHLDAVVAVDTPKQAGAEQP